MSYNLQGLRVLVTRPKPQGEVLCDKISLAGGHPIFFPTIEIVLPKNVLLLQHQLSDLALWDWMIFISPHAVMQSMSFLSQAVLPKTVKIAAVGAGTASALIQAGLPVHVYPHADWRTEGILSLPEFQEVSGKKIAIVQGEGGRELLADTLRSRGAEVIPVIAYQRRCPDYDMTQYKHLFHTGLLDIIVCTSNESVQNLLHLVKESTMLVFDIPLLVISERMAAYAKSVGFKKVILAKNANHETILETLYVNRKKDQL